MIVLIDGDLITYPCAASVRDADDGKDVALYRCDDAINRILYELGSTDFELYIRGQDNFRYSIFPDYKGNRTKPVPRYLEDCREYLVSNWGAKLCNGIETDDMLGIQQTKYGEESIIASYDKDLKQVPGWHYNFKTGEKFYVSPVMGLRNFYRQVITGDGSDNIPSYDGKMRNTTPNFIKKLQAPLDDMVEDWEMWNHCMDIYCAPENGDWDSAMAILKRNAQLLYILRKEDEHWQPPKNGQKAEDTPSS